jgi:transcriptional regulator with XRE-family HTH domain
MANIPFGEKVRRARIRNAWTQAELAAKLEVSAATISNWETGKVVPTPSQKSQLKIFLGLTSRESGKGSEIRGTEEGPAAFGVWVNRTRLERKLSVPELAAKAEISVAAIYNIESGRIANSRKETVRRLEKALGRELPNEAKQEIRQEATIKGLGELIGFDPHEDSDLPSIPGIYVFYDISERPIYVGQASNLKSRIRTHREKFWFKAPIVDTGAYVQVDDEDLRAKVETLLIRFLKSNAVLNKQNVDR